MVSPYDLKQLIKEVIPSSSTTLSKLDLITNFKPTLYSTHFSYLITYPYFKFNVGFYWRKALVMERRLSLN